MTDDDPRIPAAFRAAPVDRPTPAASSDPLRFCVATTVALIAWVITPPLAVAVFGALGIRAYLTAYRAGRLRSRCLLGDTRLVLAYLVVLTVAGAGTSLWRLREWLS